MRAGSIPHCPDCGGVSRPNILMFGDGSWLPDRTEVQESRLDRFLDNLGDRPTAVIEIGAGSAIPTIRAFSERLGWSHENATVIRINPREPDIKHPHISLACTALAGLREIDRLLAV
jgi:NAD-dependent SIR2 family protein deacetylase